MSMNSISKIQEKQHPLYPDCDKKNTIYLYKKCSRYRTPKTLGWAWRIAWHIDPFGHSNEQASIFSQMSLNGFFVGRIDYPDKDARPKQQRMELVWRGSKSLGKRTDIFPGVLYNNYSPPRGFCYDQACTSPPIQDDTRLYGYNVNEIVNKFVEAAEHQAAHYKTNNILMTMGEDF